MGLGGAGVTAVSSLVPRFVRSWKVTQMWSNLPMTCERRMIICLYARPGIKKALIGSRPILKWMKLFKKDQFNSPLLQRGKNIANYVDNWTDVMDLNSDSGTTRTKMQGGGPMTCDIWINSGSGPDKNTTTPDAGVPNHTSASHWNIHYVTFPLALFRLLWSWTRRLLFSLFWGM